MQSLTTAVKMVGRSVDKKDEIRAYIQACSKLGCSLKQLMTELSTAYGSSCVSYDKVRRWKKKGQVSIRVFLWYLKISIILWEQMVIYRGHVSLKILNQMKLWFCVYYLLKVGGVFIH